MTFCKLCSLNGSRKTHWESLTGSSQAEVGVLAFLGLKLWSLSFLSLLPCLSLAAMPPSHNELILHWNCKHHRLSSITKKKNNLSMPHDGTLLWPWFYTVYKITSFSDKKWFQNNLSWDCRLPLYYELQRFYCTYLSWSSVCLSVYFLFVFSR